MKSLLLTLTILTSLNAFADQVATLTCTGKNIILIEKSPYLGEGSPAAQSLFILTRPGSDQTSYTAYFLDNTNYDVGRFGVVYIDGKNEVGGSFNLVTNFPQDVSDGTVIRYVSKGTLTYNHGPLKGSEKVTCIKE